MTPYSGVCLSTLNAVLHHIKEEKLDPSVRKQFLEEIMQWCEEKLKEGND
jgi:cAMP phosphodiesterase